MPRKMTMRLTIGSQVIGMSLAALLLTGPDVGAAQKKKSKVARSEDPFASYVWPPPPDEPRVRLIEIIKGRADVEGKSKLRKILLGTTVQSPFDLLGKPHAVEFDGQGRILVTDTQSRALLRFDRSDRRMDVFGTQGQVRLGLPLGLDVSTDGTIYVADAGHARVLAFDDTGEVVGVYGKEGQLENPADVAVAADGTLFIADSKAHRVVVLDVDTGEVRRSFGRRGGGPGEFAYPTSLAFDAEGTLYVVDQINSRVQLLTAEGEYIDEFGSLGVGFGNLVRPKDIAIDELGLIYVTDNAFNNVQLFDVDFALLTFVGEGGRTPGRFHGASGIAVHGDEFAVVDQLGARLQLFRFLTPKGGE